MGGPEHYKPYTGVRLDPQSLQRVTRIAQTLHLSRSEAVKQAIYRLWQSLPAEPSSEREGSA